MIYQVSGVLTTKHKDFVVLEVNGVGLKIVATTNTIDTFKVKEKIVLHTYLHVREDTLDLYGFSSILEREVFVLLIGISGIGPKLAITILSGMLPGQLKDKIISGDITALTSISGVGAKTAKRIIIELKDKFTKIEEGSLGFDDKLNSKLYEDALNALLSLGYSQHQSKKSLDNVANRNDALNNNLEEIIKTALKYING
jgi:Holliday junction DNA helicase RuvA|tara:strand:+ start:2138 stop:2734 length:597 start_codon:yes stop_codon:yes gene_type:complete